MSVDQFTAKMLLGSLKSKDPGIADLAATIYKQVSTNEGPSDETVKAVKAMIGQRCSIVGTSYVGTVKGVNMSNGGFYPGGRYPVIVTIDKTQDGLTNQVFEYSLEDVAVN